MAKRKSNLFPITRPQAVGIDVGSRSHWVCVGDEVREFGAVTPELHKLADWLRERGADSIAMESTGVYWIPLFELLQSRGFEVLLVDPRQTRQQSGRPKTDRQDCQWIRRLHACGLLRGSFRPSEAVCELRGYLRCRLTLAAETGRSIQRMQKALEQMNLKLPETISDVVGLTGRAIIEAILAGERDPAKLARLRHHRIKAEESALVAALTGNYRPEHLFALGQAYATWKFFQKQLDECDVKIQDWLKAHRLKEVPPTLPKTSRRKANDLRFDARGLLAGAMGVDLTAIEGIESHTALVILSEIGPDVSRFPTAKKFAAWLGLSPKADQSGTRRDRTKRGLGAGRVARALRMGASSLHSNKSAAGAAFRRFKARLGAPKAITAMANQLARTVWSMLKHGQEYVAKSIEQEEKEHREKQHKNLERKAKAIGMRLVPA